MKKIISAFDGLRFSESTLAYSIQLARMENATLFGIFLEDPYLHGYGIEELMKKSGGSLSIQKAKLDKIDTKTRAISIRRFEQACKKENVQFVIRKQHRLGMAELLVESQYADLLVISSHEALRKHREKKPVEFIHSLLPEVRCPVLIVPAEAGELKKNVILYDGKSSSIQALRTYCHTIGSLSPLHTEIVTVYSSRGKASLPGGKYLKEYLELHFPDFRVVSLEGVAAPVLVKYLAREDPGVVVVMGAYQRSRVSRWLKPSLADRLMSKLELPLFISHM